MAAYTLPEGFTEFDMFTFGTALLVGGECTGPHGKYTGRAARIKGTVHSENACLCFLTCDAMYPFIFVFFSTLRCLKSCV